MSLIDRFVCRREGHVPMVTLTGTSGLTVISHITKCLRCGKAYEVFPDSTPAEDGGNNRKGTAPSVT